jgi:hypothetical protein
MQTANRMPAMLQDAGMPNNAHAVDESLHCSKRRDTTSRGRRGRRAEFFASRRRRRDFADEGFPEEKRCVAPKARSFPMQERKHHRLLLVSLA